MVADLPPAPVRLQLFVGPAVPVPAPKVVLDALREVTVESGSGDTQSGFELVFDVPKKSPLTTLFLLTGGSQHPDCCGWSWPSPSAGPPRCSWTA